MLSILLLSLFCSLFNEIDDNSNVSKEIIEIETTMTGASLGRKKKDCGGKGVCIITKDIKGFEIDDRHTFITLSYNKDHKVTALQFNLVDLTKGARLEFFSEKYFMVEESFNTKLDTEIGFLFIDIPKGKYKLLQNRDGFLIEI